MSTYSLSSGHVRPHGPLPMFGGSIETFGETGSRIETSLRHRKDVNLWRRLLTSSRARAREDSIAPPNIGRRKSRRSIDPDTDPVDLILYESS